jgi:hypothetical protein
MDNTEYVMEKIKHNFIDNHVSFVYEKICMEKLWELNKENLLNFKFFKLGKWWSGREEIDFIGLNEDSKDIVFCKCKYHDKPVDGDVFYDLLQKAKQVDWYKKERKEQYVLFSKSGFTHNLLSLADKRKDLILVFGVRLA